MYIYIHILIHTHIHLYIRTHPPLHIYTLLEWCLESQGNKKDRVKILVGQDVGALENKYTRYME